MKTSGQEVFKINISDSWSSVFVLYKGNIHKNKYISILPFSSAELTVTVYSGRSHHSVLAAASSLL